MKEKFLWAVAPIVGFFGLVWDALKVWFNQVLYIVLIIGIYLDWQTKIDAQGYITGLACILFGFSLALTFHKNKNGNTTN